MAAERKNKFRDNPVFEVTTPEEENPLHDIEEPKLEKKPSNKKNKPRKTEEEEETVVEETVKPKAKKKEKAPKITLADRFQKVVDVYQNERTQKILGLSLI
ncbi:MAG TPA: hypothetical protein PLC65_14895, partial [Bacteroidia bacterium]|nr:hypothetical protein [Bacteroidia bacterium]